MDAAELLLLIAGSSAGATAAIGEVNAGLTEMEARGGKASAAMNVLKTAVAAIAVVGAAVAGVSAVSVKMAADFQTQMELVRTQAHDTTDNIQQLGDQVKQLSTATGIGPDELAQGLYHVTSVGYTGAAAMQILTQAAKEAQIAGANLDDTTYSLTSVMNTFGYGADKAHDTMAQLNAIVGAGDMRFQDLNGAISTGFLAAGDTFGVSLQSMGAALAYLTDRGASAEESATRLKMSVTLLGAPTKQAAGILGDLGLGADEVKQRTSAMDDALKASGVTTTQLSDDMRKPDGIMVALQDLATHMEKGGLTADETAATLSRAFGGGRSGAAIMSMIQHLDVLKNKYDAIGKGASDFDSDWQITLGNFNIQWQRVQASLDVLAISWGQKLLPVATVFMRLLADDLVPAFDNVESAIGRVSQAWSLMTGDLSKGFTGGKTVWDVGRLVGLDPSTAGKLADQLGPTLDRLWEGAKNVDTAFRTLFAGIKNGESPVDILTGFFFQLGLNYDTAKNLSKDLVNAWDQLVKTVKDLWPEVKNLVGQASDLAGWLGTNAFPALQWVLDNGDLVKGALIAVGIGFATIKVAEVTNNILQFTSALKDAYTVAGASGALGSLFGLKSGAADVLGISGEGGGLLGGVKAAGRLGWRGAGAAARFLIGTPGVTAAAEGETGLGGAAALLGGEDLETGAAQQGIIPRAGRAVARGATAAAGGVARGATAVVHVVADTAGAIASFATVAAEASKNAIKAGAAWLVQSAKVAAGWVATGAKAVAEFVSTAAAAVAQGIRTGAAWVGAQLQMLAMRAATLLWAAAQWVLNASVLGFPLVWILLAIVLVVAAVVLLVTHWSQVKQIAGVVWDHLKQFMGWLRNEGAKALEYIGEKFSELGTWAHQKIDELLNWLRSNWPLLLPIVLGPLGVVLAIVITHWDQIKRAFSDAVSFLQHEVVERFWSWAQSAWRTATQGVTNIVATWGEDEKRGWQNVFDGIRKLATTFKDDIVGTWNNLVSGVKSLAGGISDSLSKPFHDGLNSAIGVINGFLSAVYGIPVIGGAISTAMHGFKLPQFAQGGVTSGPSIAGEGGAPEYVIPTDRQFGARARDLWVQAGHAIGALKLGAAGVGEIGGQCVEWVEAVTGHFFPVQMASEMAQYVNAPSVGPGLVGVSTIPPYGHTFIVTALNQVIDSNWVAPLTVGLHALSDIPDIVGYINLGNPLGTLAAAGVSAGKSVGSFLGALLGGPIGSAEAAAKGLGGIAGSIALGSVDAFGNALKAASFDDGGFLSPGLTLAWNGTGRPESVTPAGQGQNITVNVLNPSPQPYQIAKELAWALKTVG